MSRRARGRYLDGTALTARVSACGYRGFIKSIQVDTVSVNDNAGTGTKAITAVVLANSIILIGDYKTNFGSAWNGLAKAQATAYVELTNTTTVTATKSGAFGAGATSLQIAFTVIEFYPGVIKYVQRGLIVIAGASASNTAAVTTAVTTAKALIMGLGCTDGGVAGDTIDKLVGSFVLTSGTLITYTRVTAGAFTLTGSYQVVEFY